MPRQITEMTFTDPVYNVKVVDGDVYLANGPSGMKILDTSNPKFGVDLPLVSTFASTYPAFCVDELEKFAYVGSQDAILANSKMEIVSIANKTAPVLLGSIIPSP
jgi:hypothetical protein